MIKVFDGLTVASDQCSARENLFDPDPPVTCANILRQRVLEKNNIEPKKDSSSYLLLVCPDWHKAEAHPGAGSPKTSSLIIKPLFVVAVIPITHTQVRYVLRLSLHAN